MRQKVECVAVWGGGSVRGLMSACATVVALILGRLVSHDPLELEA